MRIAFLAILAVALPFAAVAQSMPNGQAIFIRSADIKFSAEPATQSSIDHEGFSESPSDAVIPVVMACSICQSPPRGGRRAVRLAQFFKVLWCPRPSTTQGPGRSLATFIVAFHAAPALDLAHNCWCWCSESSPPHCGSGHRRAAPNIFVRAAFPVPKHFGSQTEFQARPVG